MPRFYFHFSDGDRQFTDSKGVDLSGLAAVRAHATQQVRALKSAMLHPNVQDLSAWSMTVADANGKSVFEIGFDFKPLKTKA